MVGKVFSTMNIMDKKIMQKMMIVRRITRSVNWSIRIFSLPANEHFFLGGSEVLSFSLTFTAALFINFKPTPRQLDTIIKGY